MAINKWDATLVELEQDYDETELPEAVKSLKENIKGELFCVLQYLVMNESAIVHFVSSTKQDMPGNELTKLKTSITHYLANITKKDIDEAHKFLNQTVIPEFRSIQKAATDL